MKSKQKVLEERLKLQRSAKDRSSLLEDRLAISRASSPSQKERGERLEQEVERGQSDLYWHWSETSPRSVERFDKVVSLEAIAKEEVRPAIAFSTGIVSLDLALGGGLPSGVTEVYGRESSGKTTLITEFVQSAQGQGLECALCCGEYFDSWRYEMVGVDLDSLVLIKGSGEDALEVCASFMREGPKRALFMDSATALRPRIDKYDNWKLMLTSWLEYVSPRILTDSCVVMVNQVRTRKSVKPRTTFAKGTSSAAEKIMGYFNARLELQRIEVTELTYNLVINVVANVLSAPAKLVVLPAHKRRGIDIWKDVVRVAVSLGVLEQKNTWYYRGNFNLGQGEEAVARRLEIDSDYGNEIFEHTLRALRP